ncbi:NADP-dependent oxidoreductase [Gordonia sp. TBRC 11910]|uniref:NADP-dependent oxidoreductase n=1 Tax=Gordonia asplenii TaxID=2725283 RepID=A0A848KV51_9ACTN|nr:NADP-dependent oxidoreductase [Gordonia asplenii]NMO02754.1 NADP-dependent oxidoreductase [Gordonia asplenii]
MKAFTVHEYKKSLREVDVAEPTVGPQDVLIEVVAAGLNQLDEKVRLGEFKPLLPYRAPFVLGHDVAGTVVRVGADVSRFSVGDNVYARAGDGQIGTFAERVSVRESDVARAPRGVSIVEAASLPLVALTAWQALVVIGKVKPGDKVLIHAGAGGVGSIAIQLAKHLGATVATTVSAANAALVRELGADVAVDYRTERFEDVLSGYDLVVDGVGEDNVLRSLGVLKPGGVVVGLAGPPDPAFARALGLNIAVRAFIAVTSRKVRSRAAKLGVGYRFLFMTASGSQLAEIAELVDAGVLRPVVGKTVPFNELPAALSSVGRDGTAGKTVAVVH